MSQIDLYQISLKAIVEDLEGKMLLLHNLPTSAFAGYFDIPGGRVDIGEFKTDFFEILGREIREELGEGFKVEFKSTLPVALSRELLEARYAKDGVEKHVLNLFYAGKYVTGEVKLSEEHPGYDWIDLKGKKLEEYFTSGMLDGMKQYLSR